MKDNFSGHAADYATYRPTYPHELIAHLVSLAPAHHLAWDCATGNGQVAVMLAEFFAEVVATDISEQQLQNAVQAPNIRYLAEPAEHTSLPAASVDLVVVAQAVHWFEFGLFYQEVKRVVRPEGVVALIGYGLIRINPAIDEVIMKLYDGILNSYWDPERRYIDEEYRTIPFPFVELEVPQFSINATWTFGQLVGYLNTWSAVKHYEREHSENPVAMIEQELLEAWGNAQQKEVVFDIIARVGKV
ncbi:class I SAM-dependent methyltransferase [Pontibacter sp. MBLB2868]|uniref:class I SAM-dependent methyltransferase n=1 Tax=Pontibacter sp. MBLB2868 TaxID=3451555 RepID=UPI003F753B8D